MDLLFIAPAPAVRLSGTRLRLDAKFIEGARLHARYWDAPIRFLLWQDDSIPFGREVDEGDLGFEITLLERGENITPAHLKGAGLIVASADMHQTFDLPALAKSAGSKLVYTIEYTLDTRLRILWLDRDRSVQRKLRSTLWLLQQERRCRKAMRAADAVQFNGWPARDAYGRLNGNHLLYLDGRMSLEMMATPADFAERAERTESGKPLRIVHSGRLEPLKGVQDLIPVARALDALGLDFTLDIWGEGSLRSEIQTGIVAAALEDKVRLHAPVPFETGLVPELRRADVFLSCHRQSDPSCSYLEAMGCGLPIVGYDNAMLRPLAEASQGARVVRMGDVTALAAGIADWASDRPSLAKAAAHALAFAKSHDFETEFARRMAHLADVARA
jgi:glycosyltransferase involved in cell wall biosynthesis